MSRSYTIGDVEMPSVTTVLGILDKSDALIPWAVKSCTRFVRENHGDQTRFPTLDSLLAAAETEWRTVKDTAADIGTEIHDLIHAYIKHGRDAVDAYRPEVEHGFLAFLEWEKANDVKWLATEMTVQHGAHFYAGTLDAIAEVGGKRYVVDFKSSKGFYGTFGMQIAAYRQAAFYMGQDTDGCGILRLDKVTGVPEWKDYTRSQDRDYSAFLRLLAFWYTTAKRKLRNNPRVTEGAM